jgi:nitrogen fixation protein
MVGKVGEPTHNPCISVAKEKFWLANNLVLNIWELLLLSLQRDSVLAENRKWRAISIIVLSDTWPPCALDKQKKSRKKLILLVERK